VSKIVPLENLPYLDDYSPTKITYMGNITEVITLRSTPVNTVRIIDKDHYCYIPTGQVFDIKHIENRSQSANSIRRSISSLRNIINTNVVDPKKCLWLTLTYAENMTDVSRLRDDFNLFRRRFYSYCDKNSLPRPEYISVVEPQSRGAWHIHLFFIWADINAPFLDNNSVIAPLWQNGFTKTKSLGSCDNVGAYFSAYLADLPLDECSSLQLDELGSCPVLEKTFEDDDKTIKSKKFIKGGRLYLYPPGTHLYRHSSGIKKPIIEKTIRKEAIKKVSSAKETFSKTYAICDDTANIKNIICKSYYNSIK